MYSISYRVCNNIAGPRLVGHDTEMGKLFPGNGKFLAIFIYMQGDSRRFTGSIGACSRYYFEQIFLIKFSSYLA